MTAVLQRASRSTDKLPNVFHRTMSVFLVFSILCVRLTKTSAIDERTFARSSWCPGQALNPNLYNDSQSARSCLECTVRCRKQPGCLSADFNTTSRLCHLSEYTAALDCSNMERAPGVKHYETTVMDTFTTTTETITTATEDFTMALPTSNKCMNGGTADSYGNCTCPEPYCGPTCQQIMQDCQDVMDCTGDTLRPLAEVHTIWPSNSPTSFSVLCFGVGTTARTYIMKNTLNTSFNRPWADYKNGFGDLVNDPYDHWLGLEKIHLLTQNRAYNLRFALSLKDESQVFGAYINFAVADEAAGYAFSMFNPPSFTLLDCLSQLKGIQFSTYDNDNDGAASVNCAQRHAAGFWFNGLDCSLVCNPFGPLLMPATDARTGVPAEAFWSTTTLGDITPRKVLTYLLNR